MFDTEVDPDAFLAWLDDVGELDLPPMPHEPLFEDEFTASAPPDARELSTDRQLGRLIEVERQIAALRAEQQALLAALAEADGSVEGWCAELVSCALRVPVRTAQRMLATAQTLLTWLPATTHALSKGDLTMRHAEVIAEASWKLPRELAGQLEDRVLDRAAAQTVAQLRAAVARSVLALNPASAEERHQAARQERIVELWPADDGMAELRALLPAPEAQAIYQRLCEATRLLPASDVRTRGQQRADLLVDAVLSGIPADALPQQHGRRPSINVLVAASTLRGHDDQPGWLDGYGPITADQARQLAADPTGTWRRLVIDPVDGQLVDHGHLLDYGTTVYRPPQALADHVIARDPVCVFPTCSQPSYRADLDHIQPFSRGGPTSPDNIAPLCRRHHNAKTRGTFTYTRNPDGTFTWTDQHANIYTSTAPTRWTAPQHDSAKDRDDPEHPPF